MFLIFDDLNIYYETDVQRRVWTLVARCDVYIHGDGLIDIGDICVMFSYMVDSYYTMKWKLNFDMLFCL